MSTLLELRAAKERRKSTQTIAAAVVVSAIVLVGGVVLAVHLYWNREERARDQAVKQAREVVNNLFDKVAPPRLAEPTVYVKPTPMVRSQPPKVRSVPAEAEDGSEEKLVVSTARYKLKVLADTTPGAGESASYDGDGRWIVRGDGTATNGDSVFWTVRCSVLQADGKPVVKIDELTVGGVKYTLPNE